MQINVITLDNAAAGEIELGLHRESMLTSFWAGEGLIDFLQRTQPQALPRLRAEWQEIGAARRADETPAAEGR